MVPKGKVVRVEIKCPWCGNDNPDTLESNGAQYAPDRDYLCTQPCKADEVADDGDHGLGDEDAYCGHIFNPYELSLEREEDG